MKITYTGRQVELTPAQLKKLEARFATIGKLLDGREERDAHIVLSLLRKIHKAEASINYYGHPLIGVGLNSLVLLTGDPHNWWLEMLAEGGVLAFVLALAFFLCLWRELAVREPTGAFDARLIRGAAAATVASVAFQGLFEASFLWDFPTWVALGLATAVASWPAAGTLLPVNAVQDSVPQA